MQKIYILIPFIILSLDLHAQIPNASFESWTNHGNYFTPDGWDNTNPATASSGSFTCERATPGTDGGYYLRLTSKKMGAFVINGIAVCGKLDPTTQMPVSGFPFTGRPAALTGQWQYMAFGNDQGSIGIWLTKWNVAASVRDTIGSRFYPLPGGMKMEWEAFSIDINYTNSSVPDSAIIVLSASNELNVTKESYLYVDDLKFSDFPTAIASANQLKQNFKAYPNPAKGSVLIEFDPAIHTTTINLSDITGRLIKTETIVAGMNKYQLSLQNIGPGMYFLRMVDGNIYTNPIKLIVQ